MTAAIRTLPLVWVLLGGMISVTTGSADSLEQEQSKKIQFVLTIAKQCNTFVSEKEMNNLPTDMLLRLEGFIRWNQFRRIPLELMCDKLAKRVNYYAFEPDTHTFQHRYFETLGDTSSPVKLTVFLSATCPGCKKLLQALYAEITAGSLSHKVFVEPRPFTRELGDKALLVAQQEGKFWPFLLTMKKDLLWPTEKELTLTADSVGMDGKKFTKDLKDKRLMEQLTRSYTEAKVHGVSTTPTVFINKRKYESSHDIQWVIEAVDFIQEKK
ncbi:MAG: thioredoxin domain-containing protein [Chitinivibrionales bacterium]|nr:thioredoxin domain-containing protein [Chitinivibrionales bacterium]